MVPHDVCQLIIDNLDFVDMRSTNPSSRVEKKAAASVPSYAELLSASRTSKSKSSEKKADPASSAPGAPIVDLVGCRVVLSSSGIFGTVRYVGPTNFQSGNWVGVELDSEEVRLFPQFHDTSPNTPSTPHLGPNVFRARTTEP